MFSTVFKCGVVYNYWNLWCFFDVCTKQTTRQETCNYMYIYMYILLSMYTYFLPCTSLCFQIIASCRFQCTVSTPQRNRFDSWPMKQTVGGFQQKFCLTRDRNNSSKSFLKGWAIYLHIFNIPASSSLGAVWTLRDGVMGTPYHPFSTPKGRSRYIYSICFYDIPTVLG